MENLRQISLEGVGDDDAFMGFALDAPQGMTFSSRLYQDIPRKRAADDNTVDAIPPTDIAIPCKQSKVGEGYEERKVLCLLTMLRRCMMYYFARCCTDRLFKDPNKWTLDGDDVVLTLRFCESCTLGNLSIASAYLKYFVSREAVEASKKAGASSKTEKLSGLWRLFRLKYTLAISPCLKCADRISDSCTVYKDDNGDTVVRYRMCKRCAKGHAEMTQRYNDNFVPQAEEDD